MRGLLITILTLFWTIILLLVGGRFLALLAGANRASELIEGLYRYSEFWVSPFFNMFGLSNEAVDGWRHVRTGLPDCVRRLSRDWDGNHGPY